jgi:hypothetical protein
MAGEGCSAGNLRHVTTTTTAPLRLSRGTAFAVVALTLGVGAHVVGGGSSPDPVALVFLGVPLIWVSFFLTRARRGWPVIVGSLVAVQIGLHEGLSLLSGKVLDEASFRAGVDGVGAHAMMSAPGSPMSGTAMVMPPAQGGMTRMPAFPGFGMLAAHLLATLLTGAVLAYGEHLLWSLWTWLRRVIGVPTPAIRVPLAVQAMVSWLPTANPVPRLVDRSLRRRGPPRGEFRLPVSC